MATVIGTAITAAVALVVLWIGGRQLRERQLDDFEAAEKRWAEQQAFEREKFRFQERRTAYAAFLACLDELTYLTTHLLAHHHAKLDDHSSSPDSEEQAAQDWMQEHRRLTQLALDVSLVGSDVWYELVGEVDGIFRAMKISPPGATEVAQWFGDETQRRGPLRERLARIRFAGIMTGRIEMAMERHSNQADEDYSDLMAFVDAYFAGELDELMESDPAAKPGSTDDP